MAHAAPLDDGRWTSVACAGSVRQAHVCSHAEGVLSEPPTRAGRALPGHVAVIGAGSIGLSWAIIFAGAGHDVMLQEPAAARRAAAPADLARRLHDLVGQGLAGDPVAVMAHIRLTADLSEAIDSAAYVQECVPEDLALKQRVFQQMDGLAAPDVPLASSSSFLPASAFAEELPGRARCLVAHPGNPPTLLRLVELVPAPFSDPRIVDMAETFLQSAGMQPVRLRREVAGFVFNRLQGAVLREAYALVRDGVLGAADIDRVMTEGLGPRWAVVGPFETVDLNTRGGIAEHATRMGPAYARMGAERGQHDPWTDNLVAQVAAERRTALPLAEWDDRVAWRDRVLMAVLRARREAA